MDVVFRHQVKDEREQRNVLCGLDEQLPSDYEQQSGDQNGQVINEPIWGTETNWVKELMLRG